MIANAYRALTVGFRINEKPDIIIGPSVPIFTALSAFVLSKLKNCQFVFEVRDIWPQALIDLGVLSERHPVTIIFKMIEKFLYKKATKIIAVLPYAYRHICKYGIPREKVVWIPNGVKLTRYSNVKIYSGGTPNILKTIYLGGFSLTHDVDTIIDAALILKGENIEFIIIGGGSGRKRCEEKARKHSLNNIVFKDSNNFILFGLKVPIFTIDFSNFISHPYYMFFTSKYNIKK